MSDQDEMIWAMGLRLSEAKRQQDPTLDSWDIAAAIFFDVVATPEFKKVYDRYMKAKKPDFHADNNPRQSTQHQA